MIKISEKLKNTYLNIEFFLEAELKITLQFNRIQSRKVFE